MKYFFIYFFVFLSFNVNAKSCSKIKIYNNDIIKTEFKISIAKTPQEHSKGLMFINKMDNDYGMLFIWNKPEEHFMWMKNTLISLDMIFIKGNKIVGIIKNTTPESLNILSVKTSSDKVLEINAGLADKYFLKKGDFIDCIN